MVDRWVVILIASLGASFLVLLGLLLDYSIGRFRIISP